MNKTGVEKQRITINARIYEKRHTRSEEIHKSSERDSCTMVEVDVGTIFVHVNDFELFSKVQRLFIRIRVHKHKCINERTHARNKQQQQQQQHCV